MVVYWGMLIWVFLIGYFQPDEHNPIKSNDAVAYRAKWSMAIALMLPVTFFAAVRGGMMDTVTYIKVFKNTPSDMMVFDEWMSGRSSGLFYGLQMLFKSYISDDPTMWFGLIAVIQGVLLMVTFRRYSSNMAVSVYVFMASTIFTWMYNGIRQFLVIVVLFALTACIEKNKWYIYIPVVLLLAGVEPIFEMVGISEIPWFLGGIHQSALLMIPVFFFVQGKAWNWKMLAFILVFVLLLVTGFLRPLIEDVASETEYADDMQYFSETEEEGDDGANPIRVLVAAVPTVMALVKKREIDRMEGEVPAIVPIAINASLFTVVLYAAAAVTSGILIGRLPMYTELYNLILLPWLIVHPYKRDSKMLTTAMYGAYLMWFVYQMYIAWGGTQYLSDVLKLYLW